MSFSIRKAALSDLDDIYAIELECFTRDAFTKPQLEYCLRLQTFVTLIALLDGASAGFIAGFVEDSEGTLAGRVCTLDVKCCYRRKKIGSRLLGAFERILANKNVEVCYLEVRVDNTEAKRLYFKHDYMPVETLKSYYGFGEDGIILKKDLKIEE